MLFSPGTSCAHCSLCLGSTSVCVHAFIARIFLQVSWSPTTTWNQGDVNFVSYYYLSAHTCGFPDSFASAISSRMISTVSALYFSSLKRMAIGATFGDLVGCGLWWQGTWGFRSCKQSNSSTRNSMVYCVAMALSAVASSMLGRKSSQVRLLLERWGVMSFQSTSQSGRFSILTASLAVTFSIEECFATIRIT